MKRESALPRAAAAPTCATAARMSSRYSCRAATCAASQAPRLPMHGAGSCSTLAAPQAVYVEATRNNGVASPASTRRPSTAHRHRREELPAESGEPPASPSSEAPPHCGASARSCRAAARAHSCGYSRRSVPTVAAGTCSAPSATSPTRSSSTAVAAANSCCSSRASASTCAAAPTPA
eukprot:scaffold3789_cov296-Prasinococcus_capsulatus_cf.AAC.1